jgi:hypothetical protein
MPILSLYITYVITIFPSVCHLLLAGSTCSLRRHNRWLHRKVTKFKLATNCHYHQKLAIFLILCSFGCSIFQPLAPVTRTCLPPFSSKDCSTFDTTQDFLARPFSPIYNAAILGLPYSTPTSSVFCPIAGYPRRLCIFSHVQLHPQHSAAQVTAWYLDLPALPLLDIFYTGTYVMASTVPRLRPPRKPPFLLDTIINPAQSQPPDYKAVRSYLVAYVSGTTTYHPVPFSAAAAPICIDSGVSLSVSNNEHDFVTLKPVKDKSLSGIAMGLPIAGIGTLKWPLLTDSGTEVDLYIRNALYVPNCRRLTLWWSHKNGPIRQEHKLTYFAYTWLPERYPFDYN